MTLIYEGSSKNVFESRDSSAAIFEFTDRYSVFDWGHMPDTLPKKGEALAIMGKIFFEILGKKGIPHHYQGLTDSEGEVLERGISRFMKVSSVQVHRPNKTSTGYDYSFYQTRPTDCLVPLEVIFRWGVPSGSSLLKRYPLMKENERFSRPFIEFTTKLEDGDRHLHEDEAMKIAGLSHKELQQLKERTMQVATYLKDIFSLMNVELWDGKLEWAFMGHERDFKLVDAIGLDELRVSFMGHPLSKEFLREHYRSSPWFEALEKAKKWVKESGGDFRDVCLTEFKQRPEPLPKNIKLAAETLYLCFANDLSRVVTGYCPFDESLNLAHWVREFA